MRGHYGQARRLWEEAQQRRHTSANAGLVVRQDRAPVAHHVAFNIVLNGCGDVGLLSYRVQSDQFARIDFSCLVPGTLWIRVNGRTLLQATSDSGEAYVTGLFFPAGSHVDVRFRSFTSGSIAGSISIKPAPQEEALHKARTLFGLGEDYTLDVLNEVYKKLAKRWHPDRPSGNADKMREVNFYRDLLKERLEP